MTDILSLSHLFFPTFYGHKLVWLICMRIYENCWYIGAGCGWDSHYLLQWIIQLPTHHNNHTYLWLYSAVSAPDDGCK
jgi:hypothetical protein